MQAVSIIWQCLAYSNSCVNPIIYNHTSKDFRDAFRFAFSTRRSAVSGRRSDTSLARPADGSLRGGPQRSAKAAVEEVDGDSSANVNLEDVEQQLKQRQHNRVDDGDSLSNCSNRVHLED